MQSMDEREYHGQKQSAIKSENSKDSKSAGFSGCSRISGFWLFRNCCTMASKLTVSKLNCSSCRSLGPRKTFRLDRSWSMFIPFCMPGVEALEFENVAVELIDVGDSAWKALLLPLPAAATPAAAAALECLGYWRDEARRFLSHGRRGEY